MKRFILFTAIPILLLSSCGQTTPQGEPPVTKEVVSLAFGNGVITRYNIGDEFVAPVIIATYSDESTEDVSSLCTFTGFNSSSAVEEQVITVTYLNKTTTYTVTIIDFYLVEITLSNKVTEFYVGGNFVKPTVTAWYSDNYSEVVTDETTFSGYDMTVAGNYTVTASYQDKTASYDIVVNPAIKKFLTALKNFFFLSSLETCVKNLIPSLINNEE